MKTIKEFPNYSVTPEGKIWSHNVNRYLIPWEAMGYLCVGLCKDGKSYKRKVHRLVLNEYAGPPPSNTEGCHINGDTSCNHIYNLRWDTRSSNRKDEIRRGTWTNPFGSQKGEENGNSKLTESDVFHIRSLFLDGKRYTYTEVAEIYGVYVSTISSIVNRKLWDHVP
jgi:hypothetical protein